MVAGESLEAVNITGKRKKLKHYTALETATHERHSLFDIVFEEFCLILLFLLDSLS